MELSFQQAQALTYFDRVSAEWRMKAEGRIPKVNVIAQRNACVHRVAAVTPNLRSMLDVGCGTGELVLEMAAKGVPSTGIDFAPEMIRACDQKRRAMRQRNARFLCCSVFDYSAPGSSQDLISALGFIEYISREELSELLGLSHRLLRRRGVVALGSRNRIFNLVSLNEYTRMEIALGTTDRLMDEAIAFTGAGDLQSALAASNGGRLPQPSAHPGTGIAVTVRYQYTPGELAGIVREAGFEPIAVYPVHYHPMPPRVKSKLLEMHVAFSDSIFETAGEDHRLIPFSSSFVIAARKN
jgi:2-polyprenyl-3-methyl-5-hydroxy-6-metoxy-1,4-benzoquinol methylase